MIAIRVEYLTGRAVATEYNDRDFAEWPPHPARLYSALVAAWADVDAPCEAERSVLDWLATQPAPSIAASGATRRIVRDHYVPVNDVNVVDAGNKEAKAVEAAEAALAAVKSSNGPTDKDAIKRLSAAEKALAQAVTRRSSAALAAIVPPAALSAEDGKRGTRISPDSRLRQARTFPSVTPFEPVVYFRWEAEPNDTQQEALSALCARVNRVGHSSSLVVCSITAQPPEPTLRPDESGELLLRIPRAGQREFLEAAHGQHLGIHPRVLPAAFQRYGAGAPRPPTAVARGVFSPDWLVLARVAGPRLPDIAGLAVAEAVRGAILRHAHQPVAEGLSGHRASGERSEQAHLAVVPLPDVAHEHAAGSLLGVALVLPKADDSARKALRLALSNWRASEKGLMLTMGSAGVWELEEVLSSGAAQGLRAKTWCGAPDGRQASGARLWRSATPIALDRNPGDLRHHDAAVVAAAWAHACETIARSCVNIGLPRPIRVDLIPSVSLTGTSKARAWPSFPSRADKPQRVKVHAEIEFEELVEGPVMLGAGRYYGLGLMRPMATREST